MFGKIQQGLDAYKRAYGEYHEWVLKNKERNPLEDGWWWGRYLEGMRDALGLSEEEAAKIQKQWEIEKLQTELSEV